MAILRVERGERAPYEIELGAEDFDIGRGPGNALHFRDPWLSRSHARILWLDDQHHLQDLSSRNGTFLNGAQLGKRETLRHGDIIVLGEIELRFLDPNDASAEARGPFASDSTVILGTEELDFESYQEPATDPGGGGEESLLPALNSAASALISHFPLEELVERILELALDAVGAERGAVMLRERGGDGELAVASFHGFGNHDEVRVSHTITDEVLHHKKAILTLDAQTDERFDAALSLQLEGVRSLICVPLWDNREVTGLIYLDHRISGRTFSARDLRLVGLIANMAAVKIENVYLLEEQIEKRRMEEQLTVGAKIQRSLLPSESPEVVGYDIRGATRSCFEVGGDYYDFIDLPSGRLGVVIADVAGKGVGAALLMAAMRAALRALLQTTSEPAKLIGQLNLALLESSPANRFATLFYAELDPESHELEYVSGGHNPGILLSGDATEELMPTGPIVGLMPDVEYTSRKVSLAPDSTLLLYTDGVTELMAESHEEFGTDRLLEVVKENPSGPALDLLRAIGEKMNEFNEGGGLDDDSTAIVIRRGAAAQALAGAS